MSDLYQQLYSYLVGQVDDTLQYMTQMVLVDHTVDRDHVVRAMEMLRDALQTAEERYIEAGEAET